MFKKITSIMLALVIIFASSSIAFGASRDGIYTVRELGEKVVYSPGAKTYQVSSWFAPLISSIKGTALIPTDKPCERDSFIAASAEVAFYTPDTIVSLNEIKFSDVRQIAMNNPGYAARLSLLEDQKVICGYPDGTLQLEGFITRAEAAAFMYRLAPYLPQAKSIANYSSFSDVKSNAWYYDYVRFVYEKGIMAGTSGNEFSPNAKLTIAQAYSMLVKLLMATDRADLITTLAPYFGIISKSDNSSLMTYSVEIDDNGVIHATDLNLRNFSNVTTTFGTRYLQWETVEGGAALELFIDKNDQERLLISDSYGQIAILLVNSDNIGDFDNVSDKNKGYISIEGNWGKDLERGETYKVSFDGNEPASVKSGNKLFSVDFEVGDNIAYFTIPEDCAGGSDYIIAYDTFGNQDKVEVTVEGEYENTSSNHAVLSMLPNNCLEGDTFIIECDIDEFTLEVSNSNIKITENKDGYELEMVKPGKCTLKINHVLNKYEPLDTVNINIEEA